MRTLYLDCSTGVSGDMLVSAMAHALEEVDGAGNGFSRLGDELERLGIEGFALRWEQKKVRGIATWRMEVEQTAERELRTYTDLINVANRAEEDGRIAQRAVHVLTLLAQAEAKVHGVALESVHFHEIGSLDTVVDILGAMLLAEALDVDNIVVSPIDLGSGFVHCAHGSMSVPAPACAELAKELTTFGSDCGMERSTPTGLAILRSLAQTCGCQPLGKVLAIGYGSGTRSSDEQPCYVRAFVLDSVAEECDRQAANHHHNHA
ncbi:LarC family nickel insertion protein [Pseudodesulfovibrio sp.]|uniref:LarC family nickel insertion protein n=1 Tax=unclassified Pseudodesulfovibrio TaxID=2661612 RepID=UPI003AFFB241